MISWSATNPEICCSKSEYVTPGSLYTTLRPGRRMIVNCALYRSSNLPARIDRLATSTIARLRLAKGFAEPSFERSSVASGNSEPTNIAVVAPPKKGDCTGTHLFRAGTHTFIVPFPVSNQVSPDPYPTSDSGAETPICVGPTFAISPVFVSKKRPGSAWLVLRAISPGSRYWLFGRFPRMEERLN